MSIVASKGQQPVMQFKNSPQQDVVRRHSSDGIGYSVVDLHGVSHVFAAAVPRCVGSLDEQAHDALKTIEEVFAEEGTRNSIVKQAVFMRDANQWEKCRQLIRDFYGEQMPATTFILQPPCCGKAVSIEALGVGRASEPVEIDRRGEKCVITRHNGVSWVHCSQIMPRHSAKGVYDRSVTAFEKMEAMLASKGVKYSQVIRTWLYLGDIVGPEGDTQRYKELNRARTDFYKDIVFGPDYLPDGYRGTIYPASTGIGTSNHDVVMSCIAVDAAPGQLQIMPLENPRQTPAFDYGQHYSPKSPKFARAMAVSGDGRATIFVSGTASITDSETRWIGDAARQTTETLDNIEALISEDNLAGHGWPGKGARLDDLAFVRVYIKYQEDYEKVRAVCEDRLGELPAIYAIADVCRDDLLVEIEGIAFSTKE